METIVIVGKAPAKNLPIEFDPSLAGVDPDDIVYTTALGDLEAVEEAIRIREKQGEGRVTLICPLPVVESGLVTYDVTIGFDVPEDPEVRIGMSAAADIIIDERSDVLLVPVRAIKRDNQGNPVVRVVVDEQIQERHVVTGISDGFQTEIISGLGEGDTVVVELRAATSSSSSGGGFFGN